MASLFGAACREYQARPAYRVDGTWITYADCGARVSRIAGSLRDRRIQYRQPTGKQPTIAVLLPNSHHVLELFFTAAVTHSILFPLNHGLSAAEIEAGLRASGAMILLTSDAFAETLAEIHWETLSVKTVIWTSAPVDLPVKEHCSWDSLLSEAGPPAPEASVPAPSSYLQGFGTSGTTGRTKMVLHSHHNVHVHSFATIQALELVGQELADLLEMQLVLVKDMARACHHRQAGTVDATADVRVRQHQGEVRRKLADRRVVVQESGRHL
jgi:acyl-CoA synthetase (AMP-forming)/AMP-acid ligase II